jgi:uncharacterized membrane protein
MTLWEILAAWVGGSLSIAFMAIGLFSTVLKIGNWLNRRRGL